MNCWRNFLNEIPSLYRTIHQNGGCLGQMNCRTLYPYLQTHVSRWFSTRKDARVVLLRQNLDAMKRTRIILVGSDSKKIGEMSSQEAFDVGKQQGMEVVIVNRPSGRDEMATCKLLPKRQIKGGRLKSLKSEQKILQFKPNIAEHDLRIKIKKVNELLLKGNFVCVNVLSHLSKKKAANAVTQKRLLEQICREANGMAGNISVKATMISCVIKPPENVEENR